MRSICLRNILKQITDFGLSCKSLALTSLLYDWSAETFSRDKEHYRHWNASVSAESLADHHASLENCKENQSISTHTEQASYFSAVGRLKPRAIVLSAF